MRDVSFPCNFPDLALRHGGLVFQNLRFGLFVAQPLLYHNRRLGIFISQRCAFEGLGAKLDGPAKLLYGMACVTHVSSLGCEDRFRSYRYNGNFLC